MTLQLSGDTVTRVRSGRGIDEYTATQAGVSNAVDHIVVGRSGIASRSPLARHARPRARYSTRQSRQRLPGRTTGAHD